MSFASWIEEFYPVPADDCPREQALEHSILKWTGLLPENLEKHGMVKQRTYIRDSSDDSGLGIDGNSCALCQHYYHEEDGCRHEENPCPVVRVKGMTCDVHYTDFVEDSKVLPMLSLLRQVKEALNASKA